MGLMVDTRQKVVIVLMLTGFPEDMTQPPESLLVKTILLEKQQVRIWLMQRTFWSKLSVSNGHAEIDGALGWKQFSGNLKINPILHKQIRKSLKETINN
jgi:hypothetical protein